MLFLPRTNNIQIRPYVFSSQNKQHTNLALCYFLLRTNTNLALCYFFSMLFLPRTNNIEIWPSMLFFLRTNSIGRAIGAPGGRVKVTIWPWPACPSDTEMILRKQTVLLPFHAQRALIVAIAHRRKFHLSYQDALPISHTLPRPAQFLITDYCNTDLGCTIRLA